MLVLGSLVFCPNFWGKVLHQKRFCSSREFGETDNILRLFEMRPALGLFDFFYLLDLFLDFLHWSSSLFGSSKFFFLFNHGLDTIIHVLNKLSFASSESSLVGDIVNVVISFGVLTVGTSDLHVVLVCYCLENVCLLSKVW